MALTCTKCNRTNPAEAVFCYFDGNLLPGHAGGNGGPINAGSRLFPGEFVFPSGRRCRNFDELSLACVQERPAAVQLLEGGYIESFLGGIGRADLALLAKQAARFPNRNRGLDMLMERLPSRVVDAAKLQVEPLSLSLGQLQVGDDRRFFLHISNPGMRLLYGAIAVEKTPWLALGVDPGVPEKSFDCEEDLEIPVIVRGRKLKADRKVQEGRISVESNGGTVEVVVKLEVPVKPFPHGILSGAVTQRQLAERAFKNPKEASPLFEKDEVARWYADNGWLYPVQGPTASGIAALQQYLEACGLTQAPKLEIDKPALAFSGAAGDRLQLTLHVRTQERKPVFAYAVSDQPWLVPRPPVLNGTTATLSVEIPTVPYALSTGEARARLTVIGNGRQKFLIPVTLHVKPGGIQIGHEREPDVALDEGVELYSATEPSPAVAVRRQPAVAPWLHTMPAALLLLVLLGIVLLDFRATKRSPANLPVAEQDERPLDNTPYLRIGFSKQEFHRFGITVDRGDEKDKKLTFDPEGRTNNCCLRVDGLEYLFGVEPGQAGREHVRGTRTPVERNPGMHWLTYWEYPGLGIHTIQDVSLRRTDQTEKYETCLVKYTIRNTGKDTRLVGLRFMLDTFIGRNDGVPFTVPGKEGLCDTSLEFNSSAEIPDFIQAQENPDLHSPGMVAHLTLRAGKLEPPNRLLLTAWPSDQLKLPGALGQSTRWDVPVAPIRQINDSAVIMYWEERDLAPGQQRELGFAYGLGRVATSTAAGSSGKIALTVDGTFRPGGVFTVTAYVSKPEAGQQATLELPDGLRLVEGEAERRVPPPGDRGYSPVTWRVRAERAGGYEIHVKSSTLLQSQKVKITARSFLD
jgi:hypothetical protein